MQQTKESWKSTVPENKQTLQEVHPALLTTELERNARIQARAAAFLPALETDYLGETQIPTTAPPSHKDSVKAKRQKQLQNDQASRQKAAQWQFQNGRYVDVMRDFAPQDRERYAFMPSENASERMAVALMRPVHGEEDQEQVWEYNRRVNAAVRFATEDYNANRDTVKRELLDNYVDEVIHFHFTPDQFSPQYAKKNPEEAARMRSRLEGLEDLRKQYGWYFSTLPVFQKDLLDDVQAAAKGFLSQDAGAAAVFRQRRQKTLAAEADRRAGRLEQAGLSAARGVYRYGMPSPDDLRALLEHAEGGSPAAFRKLSGRVDFLRLCNLSQDYRRLLRVDGSDGNPDFTSAVAAHRKFIADAAALSGRLGASKNASTRALGAALGLVAAKAVSYSGMVVNLGDEYALARSLNKEQSNQELFAGGLGLEMEGTHSDFSAVGYKIAAEKSEPRTDESVKNRSESTLGGDDPIPRLDKSLRETLGEYLSNLPDIEAIKAAQEAEQEARRKEEWLENRRRELDTERTSKLKEMQSKLESCQTALAEEKKKADKENTVHREMAESRFACIQELAAWSCGRDEEPSDFIADRAKIIQQLRAAILEQPESDLKTESLEWLKRIEGNQIETGDFDEEDLEEDEDLKYSVREKHPTNENYRALITRGWSRLLEPGAERAMMDDSTLSTVKKLQSDAAVIQAEIAAEQERLDNLPALSDEELSAEYRIYRKALEDASDKAAARVAELKATLRDPKALSKAVSAYRRVRKEEWRKNSPSPQKEEYEEPDESELCEDYLDAVRNEIAGLEEQMIGKPAVQAAGEETSRRTRQPDFFDDPELSSLLTTCTVYEDFLRSTALPSCETEEEQHSYTSKITELRSRLLTYQDRVIARAMDYLDKNSWAGEHEPVRRARALAVQNVIINSSRSGSHSFDQVESLLRKLWEEGGSARQSLAGLPLSEALAMTQRQTETLKREDFTVISGAGTHAFIPKSGTQSAEAGWVYRQEMAPVKTWDGEEATYSILGGIRLFRIQEDASLAENKSTPLYAGDTKDTTRNMAVAAVDDLLGFHIIAHTEHADFSVSGDGEDGAKISGSKMELAKGVTAGTWTKSGQPLDSTAVARLSEMEALDAICGSTDRNMENFFVQADQRGRLRGVTGIDNGYAFGESAHILRNREELPQQVYQQGYGVSAPVCLDYAFPAITNELYGKIKSLTPQVLERKLRGIIRDAELQAAITRLEQLQEYLEGVPRYNIAKPQERKAYMQAFQRMTDGMHNPETIPWALFGRVGGISQCYFQGKLDVGN